MSNNNNSSVPKLRFKEFNGDWQVKKLGDVCEKNSSSISANSITNNNGEYKIYGASGFLKNIDFYTQEKPYIAIIKDGSGVGRTLLCSKKSSVIGTLDVIKNKDKNVLRFILETINKISFNKYIVGGAIPHIYFKDYSKENIFSPKPKEQQKIADCLTSLDDLITTQDKKLQNLKTHKKGLMQKLFPATSQTCPQLRFSEFKDDWKKSELGNKKISSFIKDRVSLSQLNISTYISTENLLPNYSGVKNATKLPPMGSFIRFKENDILISNIRPYLKKVWCAVINGGASTDVIVIRTKNEIMHNFLIHILKNDNFIAYVVQNSKGTKMPRGDISSIKKYSLFYPSQKEQQKIADCLTSLDDLITAQDSKITTLKTHKKGLMQQFFPAS